MISIPRNVRLTFLEREEITSQYAFMGLSKDINKTYIFADGINEHWLSAAVLYFASYATYNDKVDSKKNKD